MTDDIEREAEAAWKARCSKQRIDDWTTATAYRERLAFLDGYRARAAEQVKPDDGSNMPVGEPLCCFCLKPWHPGTCTNCEPQQPSTRELIATVRQGIGNMQHDAWSKADLALTELEKRIGGE